MNHGNKLNIIWQNSFSQPLLANNRAHVWRANLDLPTTEIERLAAVLSVDEIARANQFHFIEHRKRFIATRAILRQLLENYLEISPNKIELEYGNCGKPQLAASMGDNSLQFNISHSQEYALYGFTNHHLIGVDLEYLREMENITELSKRFFAHREFQLIADFSGREQLAAFYQLWTAKEAYLKAIGTGLSDSLTDIELTFNGRNPKLQAIKGDISNAGKWSMYHFAPAPNYVSTIIVNIKIPKQQIDFWYW